MTYVRWFGVAFGGVSVAISPFYPNQATRIAAWAIVGALAVGSFAIWGGIARVSDDLGRQRLGFVAFAFDALIVCGFVWIYAYEHPYVTWAVLFVLPLEGALRYRLRGALGAAGFIALFFIAQSFRVASINDARFDVATYVFVVGMSVLIGAVAGSMAENWRRQSLAFQQQSLKLAELDRLKDRFLAVTSHEIRGPLTAIITGTDTIRRRGDALTREQRDTVLEIVVKQGRHLSHLVDDLLLTSQIQADKLTLQSSTAGLQETIEQALEAAAGKRRTHQLEMFVDPLRCELDHSRLGQIVRNLVENAYKYTPDRTRVAVSGHRFERGIEIKVLDEGPGIPADKRAQLFDAFSRIDTTNTGQDGIGLGLYVVSRLVAAMRGRIDLSSSSRGTTFTIRIPCEVFEATPRLGLVANEP